MLQTANFIQLLERVGIPLTVLSLSPISSEDIINHTQHLKVHDWHYPVGLPVYNSAIMSQIDEGNNDQSTAQEAVQDVLLADPALKKPQMYAVVMYNDDYTPMEFVVSVLQEHFKHNLDSAIAIMLSIHHQGKGIAGVYPKDIAETKAQTVNREARQAGFPLLTQIEPQPEA